MNTNYQVGSIVKGTIMKQEVIGEIKTMDKDSRGNITFFKVKFFYIERLYYFDKYGKTCDWKDLSKLEVIGHIGEDIAIAFANYCIGEGYTSNAKPENFKRFLETYKPIEKNGKS